VRRNANAVAPDVLWVGGVTQIDTDEGPLYLATVEDMFARRLLGFAMSEHHDADLTIASLQMAAATRGGDVDGVIFHTDRGSEYTAARTAAACSALGVVQSMGRVGCALDNAAAEAFNSTLKVEFVHRQHFTTRAEARIKVATWIADFYNTSRRNSANKRARPNHVRASDGRSTESINGPAQGRSGITPSPRFEGIDKTDEPSQTTHVA
jgi:transposase InsO family protein